jgi:hypothetical protein
VQLRVTVAAAAQDTAEGAVVKAAGVAAEILSEAAGAVRISLGSCAATAAIFSADFDMCSCVVTVAAAAQDTAEGAVVTAAGVAAEILSEAAGAVRISLGSCAVMQRMNFFQRTRLAAAASGSCSTGRCGGCGDDSCRWGSN